MRSATIHGPVHHQARHAPAGSLERLLHRPGLWVAIGALMLIAAVMALTLIYDIPTQPQGWETFMWMPY